MVEDDSSQDENESESLSASERFKRQWAEQNDIDIEDLPDTPKTEEEMEALSREHREGRNDNRPAIEGPSGPEMPEPGAEVGDGESIIRVDKDVEALFRGEIDKEEFDRRIAERDPDEEPEFVQHFPDE